MRNGRNKGFTLVELMIAIAISSIVLASVAMLMGSVSRNYKAANEKVSLQMEAQLIINQMNQMIMESTNVMLPGEKITDTEAVPSNSWMIFQNDKGYIITITFDSVNHELLFTKEERGAVNTPTNELFGQYVKNFSVTRSGTTGVTFEITLILEQGGNSFTIQNSRVKIRNNIKPPFNLSRLPSVKKKEEFA